MGHCFAEHLLCSKALGHMGQSREIPSNPGNLHESWGNHANTCAPRPSEVYETAFSWVAWALRGVSRSGKVSWRCGDMSRPGWTDRNSAGRGKWYRSRQGSCKARPWRKLFGYRGSDECHPFLTGLLIPAIGKCCNPIKTSVQPLGFIMRSILKNFFGVTCSALPYRCLVPASGPCSIIVCVAREL